SPMRSIDFAKLRIAVEKNRRKRCRILSANGAVAIDSMQMTEDAAVFRAACDVLHEIHWPEWRRFFCRIAGQAEGEFIAGAAKVWIVGFFGVQFSEAVGDEMPMRKGIQVLVGADAIEGIRASEAPGDDGPPVQRLATDVEGVERHINGSPARGGLITLICGHCVNG